MFNTAANRIDQSLKIEFIRKIGDICLGENGTVFLNVMITSAKEQLKKFFTAFLFFIFRFADAL